MVALRMNEPEVSYLQGPGGLKVLYEPLDHIRSVVVGVWLRYGSRIERREEYGIAHLIEHMLFKGTRKRDYKRIAAAIESVGGEINAFTSREYCCYYVRVASRYFSLAMDVLSDIVYASTFPPDEFEREKRVVLEEIKMYEDSPEELAHDLMARSIFSSVLGHPVIGTHRSVEAIDRERAYSFYRRHYHPANLFVTIVGNVDRSRVERALERCFVPPAEDPAYPPRVPRMRRATLRPESAFARKDIEQLHLGYVSGAYSMRDPLRKALVVVNTHLGEGMTSRLFQEIREKRGLAYSVYSFVQSYRDAGYFGIYCGTSPAMGVKVRDIVRRELERLVRRGISASRLAALKKQICGGLLMGIERTSSRMMRMGIGYIYHGRVRSIDEIVAEMESVTLDDVRRAIDEVFGAGMPVTVAVGPLDSSDFDMLLYHAD